MPNRIRIRMGGYGPPDTTFSRGLKAIGDELGRRFGERIVIDYVWNVMDLGSTPEELCALVESGSLTLAYLSTSGMSSHAPAIGIADLPFLFSTLAEARQAVDGSLGAFMLSQIENTTNTRVLGFFENGFRHISNRLRAASALSDFAGMRIRVLNSLVHMRTFELLGTIPSQMGLKEFIECLERNDVDAQENPFQNTVTYGVHRFHRFHTLTRHCYISRAIFVNRATFDAWPNDLQEGLRGAVISGVALQRSLAEEEELIARRKLEASGCDVIELGGQAFAAFREKVNPVYAELSEQWGPDANIVLKRLQAA